MHGFREELLARARLAGQQHRGIGGGHSPDLAQHGFHRRALRDDRVVARVGRELLAQVLVVELEPFFELHDLRVGVLQREIGSLALERVREDVRHGRETIPQDLGPLTLVPQRTECERTHDGSSRDQRKRQVRLWSVLLEECAVNRRFRWKLGQVREPEGLALEDPAKGIRQDLVRNDRGNGLAPLDDPLMRVLENPAVGRPLKQRAAIDGEELDERSQRARDLGIHVRGRGADEPSGDVGEKPLEGA